MYQNAKLYAMLMIVVLVIGVLSLHIGFSSVTGSVVVANSGEISYQLVAKSGSPADIQSAVNIVASAGGGTVVIPAGTWHWNITSYTLLGANEKTAVVIPPGVNVTGTGLAGCGDHPTFTDYTPQTILVMDAPRPPNDVNMFGISGDTHNNRNQAPVRISGIEFVGITPNNFTEENSIRFSREAIYVYQAFNFRIDHCTFVNWAGTAVFADGVSGAWKDCFCCGVIDHCVVRDSYKATGGPWVWGYGFYARGDTVDAPGWYNNWNDTNILAFFGKYGVVNGSALMYVEDCHFSYCRHACDGCMGGFYCARFCLFDNPLNQYPCGMTDDHGVDSVVTAARGDEVYNCTFVGVTTTGWWSPSCWAWCLRGGSGLFYNNTFSTSSDIFMVSLSMQDSSASYPYEDPSSTYLWNNKLNGVLQSGSSLYYIQKDSPLTENNQYFLRAPNQAQDGFTYTPYPYPHPLTTG